MNAQESERKSTLVSDGLELLWTGWDMEVPGYTLFELMTQALMLRARRHPGRDLHLRSMERDGIRYLINCEVE